MKGQLFGEIFPEGTCYLCKLPCDKEAIVHEYCGVSYEMERKRRLSEDKCPLCDRKLPMGLK